MTRHWQGERVSRTPDRGRRIKTIKEVVAYTLVTTGQQSLSLSLSLTAEELWRQKPGSFPLLGSIMYPEL